MKTKQKILGMHGLGALLCCGGGWREMRQIGPDAPKVIWAQFFSSNHATGSFFNGQAVLTRDTAALEPVGNGRLDYTDLIGEGLLATGGGNGEV